MKLLTLLKEININIADFKELFLNDDFSKNYELLNDFACDLRGKNIDIDKIIAFSKVLKSDFLLSKLDLICKIFYFMNNEKISYIEIINIINNNCLESCREQLNSLDEKINNKKAEINNLNIEIQRFNSQIEDKTIELNLLKGELSYLLKDIE